MLYAELGWILQARSRFPLEISSEALGSVQVLDGVEVGLEHFKSEPELVGALEGTS